MAGGLRASELTHLRWRDIDLAAGELRVASSETAAGLRRVALEPELVRLLREHRLVSRWSQDDDFVFAGRMREQPREQCVALNDPRPDVGGFAGRNAGSAFAICDRRVATCHADAV